MLIRTKQLHLNKHVQIDSFIGTKRRCTKPFTAKPLNKAANLLFQKFLTAERTYTNSDAWERLKIIGRHPFQSITGCKSIITQCSRHVTELIGPRLTSPISGPLRHRSSFLPTWSCRDCAPILSGIKPLINKINCRWALAKIRIRRLIIATEAERCEDATFGIQGGQISNILHGSSIKLWQIWKNLFNVFFSKSITGVDFSSHFI